MRPGFKGSLKSDRIVGGPNVAGFVTMAGAGILSWNMESFKPVAILVAISVVSFAVAVFFETAPHSDEERDALERSRLNAELHGKLHRS